jgi:TPR repeat protein
MSRRHAEVNVNKAKHLQERAEEEWRQGRMHSAFRLMLADAKMGVRKAVAPVAYFYDYGEGTKPNKAAALYWYRRAYRNGDSSAANNIGCIWRDRNKVSRALLWLRRAVRLGDADANLNVAKIYLNRGDSEKAIPYLNKTCKSRATQGSKEEARMLLKQVTGRGSRKTAKTAVRQGARSRP